MILPLSSFWVKVRTFLLFFKSMPKGKSRTNQQYSPMPVVVFALKLVVSLGSFIFLIPISSSFQLGIKITVPQSIYGGSGTRQISSKLSNKVLWAPLPLLMLQIWYWVELLNGQKKNKKKSASLQNSRRCMTSRFLEYSPIYLGLWL